MKSEQHWVSAAGCPSADFPQTLFCALLRLLSAASTCSEPPIVAAYLAAEAADADDDAVSSISQPSTSFRRGTLNDTVGPHAAHNTAQTCLISCYGSRPSEGSQLLGPWTPLMTWPTPAWPVATCVSELCAVCCVLSSVLWPLRSDVGQPGDS